MSDIDRLLLGVVAIGAFWMWYHRDAYKDYKHQTGLKRAALFYTALNTVGLGFLLLLSNVIFPLLKTLFSLL